MKPHYITLTCSLIAASVSFTIRSEAVEWTPELAMQLKRVSHVRISPEAKRVAFVVEHAVMEGEKSEWVSQVFVASTDGTMSFQLTQGEKSATSPEWSPDGRWLAFLSARGGKDDPKANLWRIRVDGGEAEQLTDEKSKISAFKWSPDGKQIAFCRANAKTPDEEKDAEEKRDWRVVDADLKPVRLYVIALDPSDGGHRNVRCLTAQMAASVDATYFDWSPDSQSIAFSHQPTPKADDWTRTDLSIVDLASGKIRVLAATQAAERDPVFSPDGQWLAYLASDTPASWAGADQVVILTVGGGARRTLAATANERPDIVGWSGDGKRILLSETDRTVSRLWWLPADGGAAAAFSPPDRLAESPSLNYSRTHLGFTSQSPDQPVEAFATGLEGFRSTQVSHVQNVPDAPLGKTEVIQWKSLDGRSIEGLLTYPTAYQAGARVPLLVIVHGGPAGVWLRNFIGLPTPYPVSAFVSRGYAVLRPNVRGSGGYGREFRFANKADWGGGDYRDIMSGVDYLIGKGVADPDRLGIMGWSYGGYMTSWVITQTRRFKAACVGAGVTNLMSFTGTADIPGFVPDYFGGEYWDVFERWRAHSAMFNVKGISTPTLILHGEADIRVPVSQGYEFYNALKRQNVPVQMIVYPRQPHGIQEPKMMLDIMRRNIAWIDRWIHGRKGDEDLHHLFVPK
jgi:dipeptidyl aminopeptidase/acylaminoacyl peptidase